MQLRGQRGSKLSLGRQESNHRLICACDYTVRYASVGKNADICGKKISQNKVQSPWSDAPISLDGKSHIQP